MDLHRHALPVYMYVLNMNIKEQLFMYINIWQKWRTSLKELLIKC